MVFISRHLQDIQHGHKPYVMGHAHLICLNGAFIFYFVHHRSNTNNLLELTRFKDPWAIRGISRAKRIFLKVD